MFLGGPGIAIEMVLDEPFQMQPVYPKHSCSELILSVSGLGGGEGQKLGRAGVGISSAGWGMCWAELLAADPLCCGLDPVISMARSSLQTD